MQTDPDGLPACFPTACRTRARQRADVISRWTEPTEQAWMGSKQQAPWIFFRPSPPISSSRLVSAFDLHVDLCSSSSTQRRCLCDREVFKAYLCCRHWHQRLGGRSKNKSAAGTTSPWSSRRHCPGASSYWSRWTVVRPFWSASSTIWSWTGVWWRRQWIQCPVSPFWIRPICGRDKGTIHLGSPLCSATLGDFEDPSS